MEKKIIATVEVVPVRRLTWKNFLKDFVTLGIGPLIADVKRFGTVMLEVNDHQMAIVYRIKGEEREVQHSR